MMLAEQLKLVLDGEVGVFLLDPDGGDTFKLRGWRGREIFVGYWEATPDMIAASVGLDVDLALEVHSLVPSPERAWVILRTASRYFDAGRERPVSGEYARPRRHSSHR